MKKQLLVAVAAGFIATSAMAQSAFEGFYAQAGIGYENNSLSSRTFSVIDSADSTQNGSSSAASSTGGGFSGAIGLGYNLAVAPQWILGIGADFSPTSITTSTQPICSNGCAATNNYTIKNRYAIYLMPGFEIDRDKLVYVKGGYSGESVTWQAKDNWGNSPGSTSFSANGYVVGVGYKQLLDKNLYVFGEGNYYSYSSHTVSGTGSPYTLTQGQTPSAYQFLVGVGYKF